MFSTAGVHGPANLGNPRPGPPTPGGTDAARRVGPTLAPKSSHRQGLKALCPRSALAAAGQGCLPMNLDSVSGGAEDALVPDFRLGGDLARGKRLKAFATTNLTGKVVPAGSFVDGPWQGPDKRVTTPGEREGGRERFRRGAVEQHDLVVGPQDDVGDLALRLGAVDGHGPAVGA